MSRIAKLTPKFTPVKFFYASLQKVSYGELATDTFLIQAESRTHALSLLQPYVPTSGELVGSITLTEIPFAPGTIVKMEDISGSGE